MAGEGKGVARGWRRWAKAVAARPYASAVLVGVLLCTPSLGAGLVADDYMHGLMLGTWTGMDGFEGSATDLFAFTRGGEGNAKLLDEGVLTWATTPGLKLAFWRPVSSLTHALDHALWPASPEAMHLHNLVWFALSIIAAGLLFARIQGRGWVMASALMLYATDDARAPAVGWIANRNALIAATFALLALVAHDRWRRDGWRPGALAGPLAFVGAHALFLDRGPLRARALAVASWLVVVIVWRAVYDTLGYGAFGSGIYIDPGSDWLRFAGVTALHLPALLSSVFLGVWADIFSLATPSIRAAVAAAGAVAVIAFLLGVRAHVRTSARARSPPHLGQRRRNGLPHHHPRRCGQWPRDRGSPVDPGGRGRPRHRRPARGARAEPLHGFRRRALRPRR